MQGYEYIGGVACFAWPANRGREQAMFGEDWFEFDADNCGFICLGDCLSEYTFSDTFGD